MIGRERLRTHAARGNVPSERFTSSAKILDLDAVFRGAIEWDFDAILIVQRNAEARTKYLQLFFVQLFLLVRDVLAFTSLAKPVTFNRAREDDGWTPLVLDGRFVG